MTRRVTIPLGAGLVGLLALGGLSAAGQTVLPSYLAAWLFILAIPVGALPLILGYELLRQPQTATVAALRSLLPLVWIAIILALPVALSRATLYPEMATSNAFAAGWMRPGLVTLRGGLALALWAGLALALRRPPAPGGAGRRSGVAAVGLMLHLGLGTLVVGDWVAALDPALNSASLGLLILVAQAGIALSVACLLPKSRDEQPARALAALLLILLGVWFFLHFTQYLVVWSANLPDEVPWYINRDRGVGGTLELASGLVLLVALATLLPRRGQVAVAVTAGLILLMHLLEMFWLVVPAVRGDVSLRLADPTAVLGLGGIAVGYLAFIRSRPETAGEHA